MGFQIENQTKITTPSRRIPSPPGGVGTSMFWVISLFGFILIQIPHHFLECLSEMFFHAYFIRELLPRFKVRNILKRCPRNLAQSLIR